MKLYQTDESGVLLFDFDADVDPENPGEYLYPRGSVAVAPPLCGANEVAVYVGGVWEKRPDYRGLEYWTAERERKVIRAVGEVPSASHSLSDPGPTRAQRLADLKRQARDALFEGDQVATRCVKFGVAYPQTWRDRDAALVSVLNLPAGADPDTITLAARPPYPEGTGWSD